VSEVDGDFQVSSLHNSPIFQSKTLTLKNKNKIFPKLLSPFYIKRYEHSAKNNNQIFDSNLHTRLIIEGLLFCPHQEQGQYMKLEPQITNNQSSLIDNHLKPSTTVENSLQINPFHAKQTQFWK
jgi:hypothetical protein